MTDEKPDKKPKTRRVGQVLERGENTPKPRFPYEDTTPRPMKKAAKQKGSAK